MQNSNTKPFYEAIYQDAEAYSYRGGWEVIHWTHFSESGAKGGKTVANQAAAIEEAARLNSIENHG
jgi:hypothetical protein